MNQGLPGMKTCKLNHVKPHKENDFEKFNDILYMRAVSVHTFVLSLFQVQGNNCLCTFFFVANSHTRYVGVLIYNVNLLLPFIQSSLCNFLFAEIYTIQISHQFNLFYLFEMN